MDFYGLGEGSTGTRQQWIASMEAALKAAVYVESGRQYHDNLDLRILAAPTVNVIRSSSEGNIIYRRRKKGEKV